jgi:hypothetical protein
VNFDPKIDWSAMGHSWRMPPIQKPNRRFFLHPFIADFWWLWGALAFFLTVKWISG